MHLTKRPFSLLLLCFWLFVLSSCAESISLSERIKFRIPVMQESGEYLFEDVEVPAPKNLETLESDLAVFSMETPNMGQCREGSIYGTRAKFKFEEVAPNTYLPVNDVQSISAAMVYVELHKLKSVIDSAPEKMKEDFKGFFPLRVMAANRQSREIDNAHFYFGCNVLKFRFSGESDFSLGIDTSVIQHEIFHAVNYHMVLSYILSADISIYEKEETMKSWKDAEPYLHALEEGMADLWALSMTKSDDVLFQSDLQLKNRKMNKNGDPISLRKIENRKARNRMEKNHIDAKYTYWNGTNFASYYLHNFLGSTGEFHLSDSQYVELRYNILTFLKFKLRNIHIQIASSNSQLSPVASEEKVLTEIESFFGESGRRNQRERLRLHEEQENKHLGKPIRVIGGSKEVAL